MPLTITIAQLLKVISNYTKGLEKQAAAAAMATAHYS